MQDARPYFLFFAYPFLSLLNALIRPLDRSSWIVVWLFTAYYGTTFALNPETNNDSLRYVDWLKEMHSKQFSIESLQATFFQDGERNYDFFQPLLTFIVSRFTDDHRFFFGAVGLVLGYFFSQTIFFFIRHLNRKPTLADYAIIISLYFCLNIGTALNHVRMYTAIYVFCYGLLKHWKEDSPKAILICASAILFHFSLAIPFCAFIISVIAKRTLFAAYIIFIISFAFSGLDSELIRSLIQKLPLGIEQRYGSYLNEFDISETSRIILANRTLCNLFAILSVSYMFYNHREFHKSIPWINCYLSFLMVLNTFINTLGEVHSMWRFYTLSNVLILGHLSIITLSSSASKQAIAGCYMNTLLLALNTLLGMRFFLGWANTSLIFGNPITVWLFTDENCLYDYLPILFVLYQ